MWSIQVPAVSKLNLLEYSFKVDLESQIAFCNEEEKAPYIVYSSLKTLTDEYLSRSTARKYCELAITLDTEDEFTATTFTLTCVRKRKPIFIISKQ